MQEKTSNQKQISRDEGLSRSIRSMVEQKKQVFDLGLQIFIDSDSGQFGFKVLILHIPANTDFVWFEAFIRPYQILSAAHSAFDFKQYSRGLAPQVSVPLGSS